MSLIACSGEWEIISSTASLRVSQLVEDRHSLRARGLAGVRYLKLKQKLMTRSPDCTMVGVSLVGVWPVPG